mmetsp:Transcript_1076/g.4076  ORF Transcript_1076/g.4076 Transcript_1076/m.4076 type:complete len:299 (-) Transcript_1076:85-981(-)
MYSRLRRRIVSSPKSSASHERGRRGPQHRPELLEVSGARVRSLTRGRALGNDEVLERRAHRPRQLLVKPHQLVLHVLAALVVPAHRLGPRDPRVRRGELQLLFLLPPRPGLRDAHGRRLLIQALDLLAQPVVMIHYGLTGVARGDARLRQRHGPVERLAERGCHRGSLQVSGPRRGRKQLRRVGPLHTVRTTLEHRLGLRLRLVQVHHHPRELHQHGPGQLRVLHQRRRGGRELVESTLELADVISHVEEVLILHDTVAGRALRCGCAGSEENIARGAGLRRGRCGLRRRRRQRRRSD